MGRGPRKVKLKDWEERARHNLIALYKTNWLPRSQSALAERCGWGTQANVSHYLTGNQPLNLTAALRFAKAFGVNPAEISPELAAELVDLPAVAPSVTAAAAVLGQARGLSEEQVETALRIAEAVAKLKAPPNNPGKRLMPGVKKGGRGTRG